MSTEAACWLTAAVLFFGGLLLALGLCRVGGQASPAEERQSAPVDSYQGPDSLRLLEDLESHMQAYGNAVADLYDTTTGD